jgi:hypothetical protein
MNPWPSIYAPHQVGGGWEIIAPSSDPRLPAYWCGWAVDMHGRPGGCGHDTHPLHRHVAPAEPR